jgi:hypothetical protein
LLLLILSCCCTNYLAAQYFCIFIMLASSSAFVMCFKIVQHSWDVILYFLYPSCCLFKEHRTWSGKVLRSWCCVVRWVLSLSDNNTHSVLKIIFVFSVSIDLNFLQRKKETGFSLLPCPVYVCICMHVHMYEGLFDLLRICHMICFI